MMLTTRLIWTKAETHKKQNTSLKRRSFAIRNPEMIGNHCCFDLLRWPLSAAPRSEELWITEWATTGDLDFDRCLG
jgi:hypothetical protein